MFIEYIRPELYFPAFGAAKIGTILPFALLGITLFYNSNIKSADIFSSGNTKWLLFFLFLIFVSLMTCDVTLYAYIRMTQTLGYFSLFYIICYYTDTFKKLIGILFTLVVIHILLVFLNPDIILHPETRTYMTAGPFLGDGNDYALSLTIVFPMSIYLWLIADSKLKKIITLGMLIVVVLSVIGTQSRGATLGMAGVLLYMWWEGRNKIIGLLAVFLLLITAVLFAPPEYFTRMETISNYEEEGSAQGRIAAWKHATELALENPILGVGAGHFPALHGLTAHSMYFLVFAELGFPGIIYLITYLLLNIFRNKSRIKDINDTENIEQIKYRQLFVCLNGSMIGFTISGAFLSVLYYPHTFVLGAIMLSANKIYLDYKDKLSIPVSEKNKSNTKKYKAFVNTKMTK